MGEQSKYHLRNACIARGWTYEPAEIGCIINGKVLETIKELHDYIMANA